MHTKTCLYGIFFLGWALAGLGCQDYGFEELPRSVIKAKRFTQTVRVSYAADILFVVDNSQSMVGEQLQLAASFEAFAAELEKLFGQDFHIAVITTGMESIGCGPCPERPPCPSLECPSPCPNPSPTCRQTISCINETGENGRFQDRLGFNQGTVDNPDYIFETDPTCRVATNANKSCFYDELAKNGIVLVGVNGCGYERGLAAVERALQGDLLSSYNDHFLRPNATLAVIVISDEEDCGQVGDVFENSSNGGNICYFAARGEGPSPNSTHAVCLTDSDCTQVNEICGAGYCYLPTTSHPDDPEDRLYRLKSVDEYYDFLVGLKPDQKDMVKFAAIVGMRDRNDPSTTNIEYEWIGSVWGIVDACTTPGCTGTYCYAEPGTRYIKLAQKFGLEPGQNGFVDTICQPDFSETMKKVATFVGCPRLFSLSEPPLDPDLANVLINGESVPLFSCDTSSSQQKTLTKCEGEDDLVSCGQGIDCVRTWIYCSPEGSSDPRCPPPDPEVPGGFIIFSEHYDPCELAGEGEQVHIEVIYITP